MTSYQSPLHKAVKWYRKVAVELLFGTAVVNSWILYKFNKSTPILNLPDNLAKALVSSIPPKPKGTKENSYLDAGRSCKQEKEKMRRML
ncbi:hypothetical protein QE152_g6957 [Popillia japonica]|uniref:PiggyBac transposable element-derived protein domain-containing protein n=1 Tax=Popillia japonica TaxID=7064 RepID=A0AAW1MD58_POPJA